MGRKGRKRARQTNNLAAAAVLIAIAAIGIGMFLEYKLRPYRALWMFTARERGWRDQAFDIAFYSAIAACGLLLAAKVVRKL